MENFTCVATTNSFEDPVEKKSPVGRRKSKRLAALGGAVIVKVDETPAVTYDKRGMRPYHCDKCGRAYWTKATLDAHTPTHASKAKPKPFHCDVCPMAFSKIFDLKRHTRVHTGEKPYVCHICHKGFQQNHNLTKHLLLHSDLKPYHCRICDKRFVRKDMLDRHLFTHLQEKPFKCALCHNKGFIRQVQLDTHMKHKHSDVKKVKRKKKAALAVN